MDFKKIADLAESFEHKSLVPFSSRFERLMKAPSKELVGHPSAKHILTSELEQLVESSHKSPELHDLVRLIKAALSMFSWAERARHNKRRSEELGAMEAAASALDAVKDAYAKIRGQV
jgi:hypothetical protein